MEAVLQEEREADAVAELEVAALRRQMVKEMSRVQRKLAALEREIVEAREQLNQIAASDGEQSAAYRDARIRVEQLADDVEDARDAIYDMVGAASRRYTGAEVRSWCLRAIEMGAGHPSLTQSLVGDLVEHRKVPNVLFRQIVEQRIADEQDSLTDIAFRVHGHLVVMEKSDGCEYGSKSFVRIDDGRLHGVSTCVERQLGMTTIPGSRGYPPIMRLFLTYERAVAFARALNLSPLEAGV